MAIEPAALQLERHAVLPRQGLELPQVGIPRQKVGDARRELERVPQDFGAVEAAHHRHEVEALC